MSNTTITNESTAIRLYCASWVLPICAPQIQNGAVAVSGERIVAVSTRAELIEKFPQAARREYASSVLIPGLINCHSHLELTAFRGYLEHEEKEFFGWLRKLTAARLEVMTREDVEDSAAGGAVEALRAGVTCVGDASDVGAASMRALCATNLRGVVFQEAFGPDARQAGEQFTKLQEKVLALRAAETPHARAAVSPHAPYTVSAALLQLITRYALDENLSLMIHAAESSAEEALVRHGRGPFAEGLQRRGIRWHTPGVSSVQYLQRLGVLDARPLLAHCINVDEADIDIIKSAGAKVAHCPKSNAKLRHGRAPFANFVGAQLKVGLGSDSVASNNTCDLLEEARFAALLARVRFGGDDQTVPAEVSADDVLRAATLGGAEALGWEHEIGCLHPGYAADFAVVSLAGAHQTPVYDPAGALVFSSSARDVVLTVVAGRELYRHGDGVAGVDEERLRARFAEIGDKLSEQ